MLTKSGSGSLTLGNSNSFSGGVDVAAGTLYLGQSSSGGTGTLRVEYGATLGTTGSPTLTNAVTVNSGATLGGSTNGGKGSIEFSGTTTLDAGVSTVNLGRGDTQFTGLLTAPASNADLTFHSTGVGTAIMSGTVSNIANVTADNAAAVFIGTTLPTTSIQATNGGYVSILSTNSTTAAADATAFLGKITNKASFNGVMGFDSGQNTSVPTTFSNNIDLTSFTDGNVRIGTATSAILTGTITPVAQSYDFGGYAAQGGFLLVQSALTQRNATTTNLSVVSPSASGGAGYHGLGVILQGANTFSGNISVSYAGVVLDSATALPAGGNFSLGAGAYMGYTEAATGITSFANFQSHLTSSTATSILGVDTHTTLANELAGNPAGSPRTVTDAIDLSAYGSIYLGTVTGATLTGTLTAPTDNTLRLVSISKDIGALTLTQDLLTGNVNSVVAGIAGSNGTISLTGTGTNYSGGTSLVGGSLLAGSSSSLGTGAIAVGATTGSTNLAIGSAAGSVTLANNISVTDFLNLGMGTVDSTVTTTFHPDPNSLVLNGVISGAGRLYITGPTTLSGTNTYSGGTYVEANTTVTNNSGLGTFFVDIGYGAILTLDSTHPSISNLANAGSFINNAGTGTIKLSSNVVDLTLSTGTFSGQITGTSGSSGAALIKTTASTLALLGANAGQFTGGTTINAGVVAIGDSSTTGATFSGAVALNGGTLSFRPANGETYNYSGSITGSSGSVSIGTGQAVGTVNVTAGSSTFSGSTFINSGTLTLGADNVWSSASPTSVSSSAAVALQLNGNQTFSSLNGNGKINIASGKILTVNATGSTSTLSGAVSGAGGLIKNGTNSLTLNAAAVNDFSGPTTINAGTLFLTQSLSQSAVTVVGGTLGGNNSLGALATIQTGGHIAPGNLGSIGTLTFNGGLTFQTGSILDFQLNTTGSSDKILLGAGTTLTGPAGNNGITLNLSNGGSFGGAGVYTLFDFTSAATTSSFDATDFNIVNSIGGYTFTAAINSSKLQLTATAIPEPATLGTIFGAVVLGAALIRRRRSR